MKKILALALAGTLMATSSVCVLAADESEATPSIDAAELLEQLNEANQAIGKLQQEKEDQEAQISELKEQFENFKAAQEQSYSALVKENSTLNSQLKTTQQSLSAAITAKNKYEEKYNKATEGPKRRESPSVNQVLSRNNAIGDGSGGYVAQGGHVQINGGKSNVTFTLSPPSSAVLGSANSLAGNVGGTLINCVSTSSPGVSFKTATVNFTVTGVSANDTIAVYQLQGKKWVQVQVASVTNNHVTVNLTQHGPLAFMRVAAVATATH